MARESNRLPADTLPLPDYFGAKGMLSDSEWTQAYVSLVLQWPKSCGIPSKERHLIGLAKALAFGWEPGILNHTDLALRMDYSPEQVAEVLKATSVALGLARLSAAAGSTRSQDRLDPAAAKALADVKSFFGVIPSLFRRKLVLEDRGWLEELLRVARPAWDARKETLQPRLRALVCLAAAASAGWEEGIGLYREAAVRFGATEKDTADVVRSVFKTTVSNSMAVGFRTPCHIPNLEKFQTILSAYVREGALANKRTDPLKPGR